MTAYTALTLGLITVATAGATICAVIAHIAWHQKGRL